MGGVKKVTPEEGMRVVFTCLKVSVVEGIPGLVQRAAPGPSPRRENANLSLTKKMRLTVRFHYKRGCLV